VSPQQHHWVIRPLIDAGVALDTITDLLFRLGFDAIVSEGRGTAAQVAALVDDQPAPVRAAWTEVIDRMLSVDRSNV
jgi:hypothetical protein